MGFDSYGFTEPDIRVSFYKVLIRTSFKKTPQKGIIQLLLNFLNFSENFSLDFSLSRLFSSSDFSFVLISSSLLFENIRKLLQVLIKQTKYSQINNPPPP